MSSGSNSLIKRHVVIKKNSSGNHLADKDESWLRIQSSSRSYLEWETSGLIKLDRLSLIVLSQLSIKTPPETKQNLNFVEGLLYKSQKPPPQRNIEVNFCSNPQPSEPNKASDNQAKPSWNFVKKEKFETDWLEWKRCHLWKKDFFKQAHRCLLFNTTARPILKKNTESCWFVWKKKTPVNVNFLSLT